MPHISESRCGAPGNVSQVSRSRPGEPGVDAQIISNSGDLIGRWEWDKERSK